VEHRLAHCKTSFRNSSIQQLNSVYTFDIERKILIAEKKKNTLSALLTININLCIYNIITDNLLIMANM